MTNNAIHPPENNAVSDKITLLYNEWEAGKLAYEDIVNQFKQMQQDAIAAKEIANEARIAIQLGIIEGYRANYDAAVQHMEHARDLFIQAGLRDQVLRCALNIGETYRLKGNSQQARQYFRIAYDAATSLDNLPMQVVARGNEALMAITGGQYDYAINLLQECYTRCQSPWQTPEPADLYLKRQMQFISTLTGLAECDLILKKADTAWQHATQAYSIAQQIDIPRYIGIANCIIGEVLTHLGKSPDADFQNDPDTYFSNAVKAFRSIKADADIAQTLLAQGRSLVKRGQTPAGERKIRQAAALFTQLGMHTHAANAASEQISML